MISEKTINICNKEVRMRYCAAAETGFESLSGKKISVFSPRVLKRDAEGNAIDTAPSEATESDYITLALSAIVAAYSREGKEPPLTAEDILYDAAPGEILTLLSAVAELREKWYAIPAVVKPEGGEEDGDNEKNA